MRGSFHINRKAVDANAAGGVAETLDHRDVLKEAHFATAA